MKYPFQGLFTSVSEIYRNSRTQVCIFYLFTQIPIIDPINMFGTIAKAMLPQLAEATTGKNSILLENAGNIMQWMVTGTGLFFLGKAVVKSKA